MIYEFRNPIPCVTPLGDGYILYVKPNGYLENDEFAIILCEGGRIMHFLSTDITIYNNATYGIVKSPIMSEFPF